MHLICRKISSPDGAEPFVTLKDLKRRGDLIDAPPYVRDVAAEICKMGKDFDNGPISPDMLGALLDNIRVFIRWAAETLMRLGESDLTHAVLAEIEIIDKFCGKWADELYRVETDRVWNDKFRRYRELNFSWADRFEQDERFRFLHVGDIDEDYMSEEELDDLYRPKATARKRKTVASAFIYRILEKYTDKNHRFKVQDVIDKLEEDYEVKMERKAVAGILTTLSDSEINIQKATPKAGGGYWYEDDRYYV